MGCVGLGFTDPDAGSPRLIFVGSQYGTYSHQPSDACNFEVAPRYFGPGSSVGIATGFGLDSPGIESTWGARFSAPVQTGPGAHPASCTRDTRSFPVVKSGRGVTLTPYPLLVPWSRKSRAVPLLPLRAVRPVQSLSACTSVHVTLLTLYFKITNMLF